VTPSGFSLPAEEIIQELPRSGPDATLEVEEGAARPVGCNERLVGSPDLMVPRPRHPAKLNESAGSPCKPPANQRLRWSPARLSPREATMRLAFPEGCLPNLIRATTEV
jgi:hypothetical protein